MIKKLFLCILALFLYAESIYAATHYVSPTGSATWANSTDIAQPCSLATANTNADDDDIVIMADGTYTTVIQPSNSGSSGHMITYQAATQYGAVIGNASAIAGRNQGFWITKDYIKVDGVKVDGSLFEETGENAIFIINQGADHVEITNCWFTGAAKTQTYAATHLWIHDNLFENSTILSGCDDLSNGLQLGTTSEGNFGVDGYNTVENNIFRYGGHHNLEIYTFYNVVRNNFFHNEGNYADPGGCTYGPDSNSKYGNRNIQIYDGSFADGMFNLVEGNRFGPSGPDAGDDGGDGLTITAPKNIVRYNDIYSAQNNGILFKIGSGSFSDNNRVYNNTVTGSGRYQNTGPQWQGLNLRWYRNTTRCGQSNVIKNNIFYTYGGASDMNTDASCDPATYTSNTVSNNFCTDAAEGKCSANGDPVFTDGSLPAITSTPVDSDPVLTLQPESTAIDGGTYLTQANGSGSASTALIVDDALYFQDGTWGSSLAGHVADWIAVGTVTNVHQISSINYATNTITLATPTTWADDANIWLYKKSDGVVVLHGSAPDYGAHEWYQTRPVSAGQGTTISVGTGSTVTWGN